MWADVMRLLPQVTVVLKFGTAAVGLGLVVGDLLRRRTRRDRGHAQKDAVVDGVHPRA